FFFSSRRRHTRCYRDWSSDVCSSDLTTRWDLPLPELSATLSYQDRVLDRVLARLEREPDNEWFLYFVQLALFHEDMHAEAFHYRSEERRVGKGGVELWWTGR